MKLRKKILLGTILFVALAALFLLAVHHSASTALEKYRKQLVAHGEKLEISEVAPHPSFEEQAAAHQLMDAMNSLGTSLSNSPSWMKMLSPGHALLHWQEQVLPTYVSTNVWPDLQEQISHRRNELNAVRARLQEPAGSFRLDYSQGFMMILSHLAPLKSTAVWFAADAELELQQNHCDRACANLESSLALTSFLDREPLMISQLVRLAMLQISLGATWECLQHPELTEEGLKKLQSAWESIETFKGASASLEMERNSQRMVFDMARQSPVAATAFSATATPPTFSEIIESITSDPDAIKQYPRFLAWKMKWSYDEQLYNLQLAQAVLQTSRKMRADIGLLPIFHEFKAARSNIFKAHENEASRFELGITPNFESYIRKLMLMETERKILVTAIALERFHLEHKKYPGSLSELAPQYLASLPLDPMDGKPLRYRSSSDGTFVLYSVGEDGLDDGGDASQVKDPDRLGPFWQFARDIVWPTPATPEEVKAHKEKMLAGQKPKSMEKPNRRNR